MTTDVLFSRSVPQGNPLPELDAASRREARAVLRKSGFRRAFEYAAIGIVLSDAEGHCLAANRAFCEMMGYSEQELVGIHFLALTHADDVDACRQSMQRLLAGEFDSFRLEKRYLHRNGATVWALLTASLARDAQGKPLYVISQAQDITECKRAEEILRESQERYRSLIEASPDAIVLADLEGRIQMANQRAIEIFGGGSPEELVGRLAIELIVPEERDRAAESFQRALETGNTRSHEFVLMKKDGARFHGEIRTAVVRDARGRSSGLVNVARDVTERKLAEQESQLLTLTLERRARQLTALNNAGRAVASTLNPQQVLRAVIDEVRKLLDSEVAAVVLRDPASDEMVFTAAAGPGAVGVVGVRLPVSQGIVGWVMRERRPAIVDDAQTDPRFYREFETATGLTVRSVVAVPLKFKGAVWGAVAAINKIGGGFKENDVEMLEALASSTAVAMENARLFDQVQSGRRRLQALSRRMVEVQEAERHHIARELHDEIGQALTGLKLVLDMMTRAPAGSMDDSLGEAQSLTNDLLMRVREMSLNLRPAMLDDLGLLPTLLWHIERYSAMTNVQVDLGHANLDRRFAPEIETAAYRIVQEALTNVARHASVSQVKVRLWATDETLSVRVEDEGAGFDVEAALMAGASTGLSGMRERVALLGGRFNVESKPGAGASLTAELPLSPKIESNE